MSSKFYLTGEELKKWRKYRDSEIYNFTFIPSFPYGYSVSTPVDVMLDESQCYITYNHPLWLYFKNGYTGDSDWLLLVITKYTCYVPLHNYDLKIAPLHFLQLCNFVKKFYSLIEGLANKEIDYEDFSSAVRGIRSLDYMYMNENQILYQKHQFSHHINEMAKVSTERTGLPREIWVDNGRIWFHETKHGPRLKFEEPVTKIKDSKKWPSIPYAKEGEHKVDKNTPIEDIHVLAEENDLKNISTEDLNHLKYFVRANIDLLLTMTEADYPMEFFLNQFKKVDSKGNITFDPNQKPYIVGKDVLPGIALVTDKNTGKHNFEKDGKLLSPKWFDFFNSFKEYNGKQRTEVYIDGQKHFLDTDGTLN